MPWQSLPMAASALALLLCACSTAAPPPCVCPRPPASLLQPLPATLPPIVTSPSGPEMPSAATKSAPPASRP